MRKVRIAENICAFTETGGNPYAYFQRLQTLTPPCSSEKIRCFPAVKMQFAEILGNKRKSAESSLTPWIAPLAKNEAPLKAPEDAKNWCRSKKKIIRPWPFYGRAVALTPQAGGAGREWIAAV
jgi:hypothetical protein